VALARALVLEPELLLLDEPLGAIDLQLRKAMQLELRQLNRTLGITFVYVTHDQEEALTMSDRIAVMDRGRIEQLGSPAEVYEFPRTAFVAGFIGESNLLQGPEGELIAVRPERIELLPPLLPPADRPAVLATVVEVSYLGDRVRIQLARGGDGGKLTAMLPAQRLPVGWAPGDQVLASWRAEDGRRLDR